MSNSKLNLMKKIGLLFLLLSLFSVSAFSVTFTPIGFQPYEVIYECGEEYVVIPFKLSDDVDLQGLMIWFDHDYGPCSEVIDWCPSSTSGATLDMVWKLNVGPEHYGQQWKVNYSYPGYGIQSFYVFVPNPEPEDEY